MAKQCEADLSESLERETNYARSARLWTLLIILPLACVWPAVLSQLRPTLVVSANQLAAMRNRSTVQFSCHYQGRAGTYEVFEMDGELIGVDATDALVDSLPPVGKPCRLRGRLRCAERIGHVGNRRIHYRLQHPRVLPAVTWPPESS